MSTDPDPPALDENASWLRRWRYSQRLTLRAAATRFGTTEATLSRIETGANPPSRELEERLCVVTGLSRDQIIAPWRRRRLTPDEVRP